MDPVPVTTLYVPPQPEQPAKPAKSKKKKVSKKSKGSPAAAAGKSTRDAIADAIAASAKK
jgi:hypothetical protein